MVIIGVTGSFGTGKTTVARFFRGLGATVLDADKIAHEALLSGTQAYRKILKIFGKEIIKYNAEIDRKKLGEVVFKDKEKLKKLCNIIHPYVIERIKKGIKGIKRENPNAVIILDIPLLVEAGLFDLVDKLIVVKTDKKTQVERCQKRAGLSKGEILRRIKTQAPLKSKIRFSDFVIDNSETKKQTKREVKKTWEQIQQQIVRKKRI